MRSHRCRLFLLRPQGVPRWLGSLTTWGSSPRSLVGFYCPRGCLLHHFPGSPSQRNNSSKVWDRKAEKPCMADTGFLWLGGRALVLTNLILPVFKDSEQSLFSALGGGVSLILPPKQITPSKGGKSRSQSLRL